MSSVIQDNALPSSLSHVVKKISGYRVNTAKLLPDSSSSVAPGGQIQMRLPSNSILDFSSLMMHCTNTIAGTNVYSPSLEQYISRLELRFAGESVLSQNNYGDCFQMLLNASLSTAHQETRRCTDPLGPRIAWESVPSVYADTDATKENATGAVTCAPVTRETMGIADTVTLAYDDTGGASEKLVTASGAITAGTLKVGDVVTFSVGSCTVTAVLSTTTFNVDGLQTDIAATAAFQVYRPGTLVKRDQYNLLSAGAYNCVATTWLGLQDLGVLDMSLFPACELVITFAGNNILSSSATNGTWALSNIYFTIPTIQFPQWTSSLYSVIQPDPQSGMAGGELSVPFKNYTSYTFDKPATDVFDLKFSLSTDSLDRIWYTMKNAYTTQAAKGSGRPPAYFRMTDTDTGKIQYLQTFIDEQPYPHARRVNYSADGTTSGPGFAECLRELKVHNNNQYDCAVDSAAQYSDSKFFSVWDFTARGGENEISGLNTMGLSSNIRVHIDCTAALASGAGNHYVFCETTQVLHVSAGRNVRLTR